MGEDTEDKTQARNGPSVVGAAPGQPSTSSHHAQTVTHRGLHVQFIGMASNSLYYTMNQSEI